MIWNFSTWRICPLCRYLFIQSLTSVPTCGCFFIPRVVIQHEFAYFLGKHFQLWPVGPPRRACPFSTCSRLRFLFRCDHVFTSCSGRRSRLSWELLSSPRISRFSTSPVPFYWDNGFRNCNPGLDEQGEARVLFLLGPVSQPRHEIRVCLLTTCKHIARKLPCETSCVCVTLNRSSDSCPHLRCITSWACAGLPLRLLCKQPLPGQAPGPTSAPWAKLLVCCAYCLWSRIPAFPPGPQLHWPALGAYAPSLRLWFHGPDTFPSSKVRTWSRPSGGLPCICKGHNLHVLLGGFSPVLAFLLLCIETYRHTQSYLIFLLLSFQSFATLCLSVLSRIHFE